MPLCLRFSTLHQTANIISKDARSEHRREQKEREGERELYLITDRFPLEGITFSVCPTKKSETIASDSGVYIYMSTR